MDIDLTALRSLEAEKDISMDLAIKAIEDALLVAYHHSDGAATLARVEVNRQTGHVTVWAGPASGTATSRPMARRQCRRSVSGRSTPGEETSRM